MTAVEVEAKALAQFWLKLLSASCQMGMKEESEEDVRPLCDYLMPKEEPKDPEECELCVQPKGNSVEFLNLKKCYEKIQTRRDGISAQRPMDCSIRILAVFDPAWPSRTIDVFVQRHPDSAKLCGDINGKVNLKVTYEEKQDNMEYFSVNLDSVYKSPYGTPVYKLSTVDPVRRNRFILIVRLSCLEQNQQQYFTSSSFQVRSRRPKSKTVQLQASKEHTLEIRSEKS